MAAHLECHPRVHATVNFVPVLLDQFEDYGEQFASGKWRDPLLRPLAAPDLDRLTAAQRKMLLDSCFRSNHANMIEPFPRYKRLRDLFTIVEDQDEAAQAYVSGAYLSNLIAWYHLTWAGEMERRRQQLLAELMARFRVPPLARQRCRGRFHRTLACDVYTACD